MLEKAFDEFYTAAPVVTLRQRREVTEGGTQRQYAETVGDPLPA